MVGPCPCGAFHGHGQHCYWAPPPYDSAVDCTLSLGTPATRRSSSAADQDRPSRMSGFCGWNFLQTKSAATASHSTSAGKSSHRAGNGGGGGGGGGSGADPLLARRCANCDTTSTPLWRNGPRGPKSLCNACGIRFKKEERRATAAAATNSAAMEGGGGGYYNGGWGQPQKVQYFSPAAMGGEYGFMDDVGDSDSGIQYLSWRLNVTDRPTGFVHEFTR